MTTINRRNVLFAGAAGLGAGVIGGGQAAQAQTAAARTSLASSSAVSSLIPKPRKVNYLLKILDTDLNPDGEKSMKALSVNGTFPGPEIRMREGEMFRAQVENHLDGEETSIHWHGLLLPAVMDGVPGVSHTAIAPKEILVSEFPLLQSGTYWYHSHSGLQEQVGSAGPFIIEAENEVHDYDRDFVIFLSDWLHEDVESVMEELKEGEDMMPGMGMEEKPDLSDVKYPSFLMNGKGNNAPWSGEVSVGEKIRLRIIGAGASTLFKVMLADHKMMLSHVDGLPVELLEIDNLLIGMGETYDVIVTIQKPGAFTLHAMAQDGSGQAVGVLHTVGAAAVADLELPVWGSKSLAYSDMRSLTSTVLPEGPLHQIDMTLTGDMSKYAWGIDGKPYGEGENYFIKEGERVRVTMRNETGMWHPMHLHGHFFRVLAPGADADLIPLKHTVNVAPKETLSFEFIADNPGRWIFHCHNLYHAEAGMGRVFIYQI
jgi:multicopper oxidase